MLNFKQLSNVYISFLFFLLLFYNGGLFDFNNVPVCAALSIFLSAIMVFAFDSKKMEKSSAGTLVKIFLLNCFLFFLSSLTSKCLEITYTELIRYLNGAMFFIIIAYTIDTKKGFDDFIKVFLFFIGLYIFLAFAYFFYTRAYSVGFTGIYSTLFYPYYYATLAVTTLPFCLYRLLASNSAVESAACYVLFALQCMSVLFTSSRVAQFVLITVVASIFSYAFFQKTFRSKVLKTGLIFLLLAVISFAFCTDAFTRILNTLTLEGNFDIHDQGGRLNILKAGWATFLKNPLLGVGTGLSGLFITEHAIVTGNVIDTHNIILNILCENGIFYFIVKLLTICAFIYAAFLRLSSGDANTEPALSAGFKLLTLCSGVSIVAIYLQGFSLPHTYLGATCVLEFILFGFFISSLRISENHSAPALEASNEKNMDFDFPKFSFYFYFLTSFIALFLTAFILFSDTIPAIGFWLLNLSLAPGMLAMLLKKNHAPSMRSSALISLKCAIIILLAINIYFAHDVLKSGIYFAEAVQSYKNGEISSAAELASKSLEQYPNFSAGLFRAKFYYDSGEYERSLKILKIYNAKLPYELFGAHNLAVSLIQTGNFDEAKLKIEEYARYASNDFGRALAGAFMIEHEKAYEEGIRNFAKASAQTPDFIVSRFFVKNILADEKRLQIFMDCLERTMLENLHRYSKYPYDTMNNFMKSFCNLQRLGVSISYRTIFTFAPNISLTRHSALLNLLKINFKDLYKNLFVKKIGVRNNLENFDRDYYIHLGLKVSLPSKMLYKIYGIYSPVQIPNFWTATVLKFFLTEKLYRRIISMTL